MENPFLCLSSFNEYYFVNIHLLPLNKFTTSSAFCQHLCKETLTVLSNVTPGKNIRNSYPQGYTENNKRRVNTIGKASVTSPTTPRILISASNERYIKTPGTIGMTEGIVST